MTDQRASLTIRMPRSLLDRLKEEADARSHSMNAEIVQRLEATLLEPAFCIDPADIPEGERKITFKLYQVLSDVSKLQKKIEENTSYFDDMMKKLNNYGK